MTLVAVGVPALPAQAGAPAPSIQAQTAYTAAAMPAKAKKKRGINVTDANITANGRWVTARVKWDDRLLNRVGKNHRFNMRLVAVKKNGKTRELDQFSTKKLKAKHRNLVTKLGRKKAKRARNAHDLVLSLSQQHDRPKDNDKLYERNFVTSKHLRPKSGIATMSAATHDRPSWCNDSDPHLQPSDPNGECLRPCPHVVIKPRANLNNCKYPNGVYLHAADLAGASLNGAVLFDANLTNANLNGVSAEGAILITAILKYASLNGVHADGADLDNAVLKYANLTDAQLLDAILFGADLRYTDLTNAFLARATLDKADWSHAKCSNTTWNNGYMVVGPDCPPNPDPGTYPYFPN